MDTKNCEHCGKEIEVEFKREKVMKTKIIGGVVTYTGESELVKKYKSAICSKCGGTFCLDCLNVGCKDKHRNIVLTYLCPACIKINPEKTNPEKCNHNCTEKKFVFKDNNSNYYTQTCTICNNIKKIVEPIKTEKKTEYKNINYKDDYKNNFNSNDGIYSERVNKKFNKKRKNNKINKIISKMFKMVIIIFIIGLLAYFTLPNLNEFYISNNNSSGLLDSINNKLKKGYETNPITYYDNGILTYIVGADGENIYLTNYDNATNPTYEQLKQFLANDNTNTISYNDNSFTCGDFAETLHNNAEKSGLKCGYVTVDFEVGVGHALNIFNTTDKGTIFIDCTNGYTGSGQYSDTYIPNFKIGENYIPKSFFNSRMYYENVGIVKDYDIYW
ncbi:MAG: hypothetical protein RBT65_03275 [Methanolobus sp.]|nr:hypothetical protein [Methanolobus sp.]